MEYKCVECKEEKFSQREAIQCRQQHELNKREISYVNKQELTRIEREERKLVA